MKLSEVSSPEAILKHAIGMFKDKLENADHGYLSWEEPVAHGKGLIGHVRDFGDWEVPEGEEDDGDYDWKQPTAATRKKLDAIKKDLEKIFPKFKFCISVDEKNWISYSVEPK